MQRKKRQLNAIVFDFDGTLAKLNIDFALMRRDILALTAAYGVPTDALKGLFVLEMIEAGNLLISRSRPGKGEEYRARANARIREIEMEAARSGGLFAGTRDFLLDLRMRGIKTGVISRNCRQAIARVFPDIGDFTDAVLARDAVQRAKPHPEHLRATLQALEITPEDASMVGDHPMDISMGKELSVFTVGVLSGHARRQHLQEAGADLIIDEAKDLVAVVL